MKVLIVEDDPLHRTYLHEAVIAACRNATP